MEVTLLRGGSSVCLIRWVISIFIRMEKLQAFKLDVQLVKLSFMKVRSIQISSSTRKAFISSFFDRLVVQSRTRRKVLYGIDIFSISIPSMPLRFIWWICNRALSLFSRRNVLYGRTSISQRVHIHTLFFIVLSLSFSLSLSLFPLLSVLLLP